MYGVVICILTYFIYGWFIYIIQLAETLLYRRSNQSNFIFY